MTVTTTDKYASNPVSTVSANNKGTEFVNADGTTLKDIFIAGTNGSVIKNISACTDDTSPSNVQIFFYDGSASHLINTISVAGSSGATGATSNVSLFSSTNALKNDNAANKGIPLESGQKIQALMESNNNTGLGSCLSKQYKIMPEKTLTISYPSACFYEDIKGTPLVLPTSEPALGSAQYSYTVADADKPVLAGDSISYSFLKLFQLGFINSSGGNATITVRVYVDGVLKDTQTSATITNGYYCTLLYYKTALLGLMTGQTVQITIWTSTNNVFLNYYNRFLFPARIKIGQENSLSFNIDTTGFNNFYGSTVTPRASSSTNYWLLRTSLHPTNTGLNNTTNNARTSNVYEVLAAMHNHSTFGAIQSYWGDMQSFQVWSYSATAYQLGVYQYPTYIKYQPTNIILPTRSI